MTSFLLMIFAYCSSNDSQKAIHAANAGLDTLVSWMTGSFSSKSQSRHDSDFVDVCLPMVPIWSNLENGYWMYVEQALASRLEKPYRQRVYQIFLNDSNKIQSDVLCFFRPGEICWGL